MPQGDDTQRLGFPEHNLSTPPISRRLQTILDLLGISETLADVGTDHGYLAVAAYEQGKAQRVVASDINEPPLHAARVLIARRGLAKHIHTRLGDGLLCYKPVELQQVVIAGMGGVLIHTLLQSASDAAPGCLAQCKRLVLQPMNHEMALRQWLSEHGWPIEDERLIEEKGKLYHIIVSKPGTIPYQLTWEQLFCGPVNMVKVPPALMVFVQREWQRRMNVLSMVRSHPGNEERVADLESEIIRLHCIRQNIALGQ